MNEVRSVPRVHIGRVIQNAAVFNLKNWRGGLMNADNLPETVQRLFALLDERKIDYLLVGGVALLQYIEGRNTEDIDLIVAADSLKKLPEIAIEDQNVNFAQGRLDQLRIDILLTGNPLFETVRRNYRTSQPFVEREIACASVEGLLLLKLYALPSLYRQGNFARVAIYEGDIAALLHEYRPQLAPLLAELARHLSETDLAAVREVLADIEKRIKRFGKNANAGQKD